MNDAHDRALVAAAPKLYRDRFGKPMRRGWTWGFECGDGWYGLLLDASIALEALINALPAAEQELAYATQVKEKFGTLRFYMFHEPPGAESIIETAEGRSAVTCEMCGAKARSRNLGGWLSTRCARCYKQYLEERKR